MERITIVGLGLIGSSIGLALKKAGLKNVEIVGHDREPEIAGKSRKRGAVDKVEWNLFKALEGAGLVIIATPALAVKTVFGEIAGHLPENCVVTDTCSTKANVMNWAAESLPSSVHFVGGHPMAGKESSGPEAADADLFVGCTYCLVPSPTASEDAVQAVVGLVNAIGGKPFYVDAAEHDGFVAGISHLPIVLSTALVSATMGSASWREMSRLAASGFRDVTRLASGDATMHRDICLTNRESIIRWIDRFIEELTRYKELIAGDEKELEKEFLRVQFARDKWLHQSKSQDYEGSMPEIPSMRDSFATMLMGRRLADASKMKKDNSRNKDRR